MRTGADLIVEVLRDEGVTHVFGNPGSTELGLIEAITRSPDLEYVLGLHEGCVVPMADGFAQATGRTGFVSLHTMSGLGNAIGVLANAKANGTPLVITAGQQAQALLADDPLLGYDLVAMAAPVCKWAREVRSVEELGPLLRRAFADAAKAPAGPVFLSLPMDVVAAPAPPPPPRSVIRGPGVAAGMPEMAQRLGESRRPAIVCAQEAATREVIEVVDGLARRLGAPVFNAYNSQRAPFPPSHPHAAGDLPAAATQLRATLAPYDTVLFVGGQAFQLFADAGPVLPERCALLHLAVDPSQLGRSHPAALGAYGDLAASLQALAAALPLQASTAPPPDLPPPAPPEPAATGFDALTAARILVEALPADGVLHNEAPSIGPRLRGLFHWSDPGQFYSSKQTIGWAMGAAVGVSLGHRRARASLVIVGDGSAAFSLQALWSAAREDTPVVFAVLDNRRYGILELMSARTAGGNRLPAFDLAQPPLDFVQIARGFGVEAVRVADAASLRSAITDAFAARKPRLLHILVP
jgi:benzoylformate decarboxylase